MELFYDQRDDRFHEARGSQILYWLDDLGARPFQEAKSSDEGFLFTGARPIEDYRQLVAGYPRMRDRPAEREPLLRLDTVLSTLDRAEVRVPTPRTWQLPIDSALPKDLTFPLFVRTAASSWKVGGKISRVTTARQLEEESSALRRAFGWDATILVREWLDLAEAGTGIYGPVPQEVRVWIVDRVPYAWSFHFLNVLREPVGLPPTDGELQQLTSLASLVASAFASRLVAADFARLQAGDWCFIEAGPGSCASTAHEAVFKAVASRLIGQVMRAPQDAVGGLLPE